MRKLYWIYSLYGRFLAIAIESDVRDEGEIEHKKSGCTLMMAIVSWEIYQLLQVWFNKIYFPCDKIWRTEMDWWGDLGYSLVYKIFEKTYLISGWTSC